MSDKYVFHKERHIKYWLRCARTFLPNAYTSNDSSRMTLAFFIVAALDLLGTLETSITQAERSSWIEWIYSCQTPEGGFRGFTGTDLCDHRNEANQHWDPANLPATFFALLTLIILGDDLSDVDREKCMTWLPKLQRENGSFGETLTENGQIEGGNDLRFCCCAAGTVHLLRSKGSNQPYADMALNRIKLMQYVRACQVRAEVFLEFHVTANARHTKVASLKDLFAKPTVSHDFLRYLVIILMNLYQPV